MGKSRDLTEEEQLLWEQATAGVPPVKAKKKVIASPLNPSPQRGEARRGAESGADRAKLRPHPNPPPQGEGIKQAKPAPPLTVQPKRLAERSFKQHARIEAWVDLHGMTQTEAHEVLLRFMQQAREEGKRHVAIITGKGRGGEGVLKRAVPQWLEMAPLRAMVSAITYAAPEKGGEGVLHVLLKKW